jgi:hypothetical protein
LGREWGNNGAALVRTTRLQGCFLSQKLHPYAPTFFKTAQIIESHFGLSKIYFKGKK